MTRPFADHATPRDLPSIDRLLRAPGASEMTGIYGHSLATGALRAVLDETRAALLAGRAGPHQTPPAIPADETLVAEARERLEAMLTPTLRPVINATGIILHTNLGRAPLSDAAMTAMASVVLLMLTALCRGREVLISRGQLVEIGGGFRVPDVMEQSGAWLVEVGTTNRTHLRDYAGAVTADTAAILVVHHSNYKIVGFAGEPPLAELAALARERGLLLLYDQGSGAMLDTAPYGLEPEPAVPDGLAAGADVVAFSGDKLLGGPQAGILAGRAALIERARRHPLARAVRADKLALAALTATLDLYLTGRESDIPVWRMIARPLDEIAAEAERWARQLRDAGIDAATAPDVSYVGGGSLPGESLPTRVVAIHVPGADGGVDELAARLRARPLPVIARIHDDRLLLDPRTVRPGQSEAGPAAVMAVALGQ